MLTDQQIDEFLEMVAKSPTSARDMVRGLFAAHEAKAAPAVPQGYEIHEIPADYSGLVWLEGQVRAVARRDQAATGPQGWTDADSDAARLALELECLLMDTKDLSVVSKWWGSANDALELHRQRLAATPAPAPAQEAGLTDGWISVGDRLPDGELGYPAIEFYNEDLRNPTRQVIGIYRDGDWFSGGHQFSNVTYWKPLTPAPLAALRAKGGK